MSLLKKLPKPMLPDEAHRETQARESYHVLKTISESIEIGEELRAIQLAVSIYGSAHASENHPDYEFTLRLARKLSDAGFSVISGGEPGIVEVANEGASAGASLAVRLNIVSPYERKANPYQDLSIKFQHFFPRRVMSVKYAAAYAAMLGGFGTLDELFENLTLVQMGRTPNHPIILVGRDSWSGLLDQVCKELLRCGLVATTGMDLIRLIDDEDEITEEIFAHYENWLEMLGELGAGTWSLGLQVMYCHCRSIPEGADRLKRVSDGLWFRCVRNIDETAIKQ